jgi:phenylalanine-4-hydroxylase
MMKQEYHRYTEQDRYVWKTLFDRQHEQLKNAACRDYLQGLELLSPVLNANTIPDIEALNKRLYAITGWKITIVPGLIPVEEFFILLLRKQFPSSTWLRQPGQLDYLEEPDMFHDIFGHVPLLAIPKYAQFMQQFGELGTRFLYNPEIVRELQRLYWYTIEFGLVKEDHQLKICGAGLASSFGETKKALQENTTKKIAFDLNQILNDPFENDRMQEHYYVLNQMEELFSAMESLTEKLKTEELESVVAGSL